MAINGINSYGMGYYNYQSSINNMRLRQALAKNPGFSQSVPPVSPVENSLKSGMEFVKKYSSGMSDLMSAANELRGTNRNGVMHDLSVTSSNDSVAAATEKLPVRSTKDIKIDVAQIARAQSNVSDGVKASGTANADMNFRVGNNTNFVDVQVSSVGENGALKSNAQMLEEAANQINGSNANIQAAVIRKDDGTASLKLEAKSTGAYNGFQVSGELGAAQGAEKVDTQAQNAKYSVTEGGRKVNYESSGNNVSVDGARIGVTLKGAGETEIKADVDVEKMGTALSNLVDSYNSSIKLLNDNYGRGSGVDRQLRNLVRGLGSEQSLGMLGITVNKDATLTFDKSVLQKSMKDDPSFTKDLITGPGGIADSAFNKAVSGMEANSSSLIDGDLAYAQMQSLNNPFNMLSMYSRSGVYSMNNYAAVGLMMNYLV